MPNQIGITYFVLFLIGLFYNRLVTWLDKKGMLDALKALLVVGGCAYTIVLSAPLIGLENAALVGGAFLFALLPVTIGDLFRYLSARQEANDVWREITQQTGDTDDA